MLATCVVLALHDSFKNLAAGAERIVCNECHNPWSSGIFTRVLEVEDDVWLSDLPAIVARCES